MSKPISRQMHGVLDYGYAALIAGAPELVGFEDEETAVTLCRGFGAKVLLLSLFTRYELGLFRLLPFKWHLHGDMMSGIGALAAPWLFKFDKNERARGAFIAFGVLALVVSLLTRPEEMD